MTTITTRWRSVERFTPLAYLLLITLAEVLTTYSWPAWGLGLHALVLLTLLMHAALGHDAPLRALALTLCIAPIIRILSVSLPLARLPQISWYVIVSVPLFIACALMLRVLGYSRRQVGLSASKLPWQALVVPLGLLLGACEYAILRPQPLIAALTWQQLLLPALIMLVCTGFGEELIFRGIMQRAAYEALGRWAIVYVAALFAVLHIGYRSIGDLLFVFAVGLAFGLIVARTGSLLGVTLAHGLTNIMLFLVLPFTGLPATAPLLAGTAQLARSPLLWAGSLALVLLSGAGLLFQRNRRQTAAGIAAQHRWVEELTGLLNTPAPDATTLEQLAYLLREHLAPAYVLIAGHNNTRSQALVELAVGATGRRLRGIEGLSASASAFVDMLALGINHGAVLEVATHPFSRQRGDYLLLPLTVGRRWAIVSLRPGLGDHARALLTPLAPTLLRQALGELRAA